MGKEGIKRIVTETLAKSLFEIAVKTKLDFRLEIGCEHIAVTVTEETGIGFGAETVLDARCCE